MEWNRAMFSRARAEVMPETVGTPSATIEDLNMPIWMLLGYRRDPEPNYLSSRYLPSQRQRALAERLRASRRRRKIPAVVRSLLCRLFGHRWRMIGSRACPRGLLPRSGIDCTQPVFLCARCETYDYGEAGGPGAAACLDCDRSEEKEGDEDGS